MARISAVEAGGRNVLAFLDAIAWSEIGPPLLAASDDGYDVIVGSTAKKPHLFQSYADHPQTFVTLSPTLRSSAAGRYQFLAKTWDALAKTLKLPDFSPESQDRGAIQLLSECHAYPQIINGNIPAAIRCANPIWASLPGSPYGQPVKTLVDWIAAFDAARKKYPADFTNVVAGSASTAPTL